MKHTQTVAKKKKYDSYENVISKTHDISLNLKVYFSPALQLGYGLVEYVAWRQQVQV